MILLLALLGCSLDPAEAPVALPPPSPAAPAVVGRTAAYGALRAFIARPKTEAPVPGLLLWAPALDEASRSEALRLAEEGRVVVVFEESTDASAARAWFARMEGISTRDEGHLQKEPSSSAGATGG